MMIKSLTALISVVTWIVFSGNSFAQTSGTEKQRPAESNWMAEYVRLRVLEKNLRSISEETTRATDVDLRSIIEPKIVGGTDAQASDNPFQVALLMKSVSNNADAQFCGGTLIKPKFVVTAAHCSDFVTASQVQALTGTRRLDGTGDRRDVTNIVVHPDWNSNTFDNDVAVWELSSDASDIPMASLATEDGPVGRGLLATGWGRLTEGGTSPIDLQRVEVPLVDRTNCNDANSYDGDITGNMICAGLDQGGRDACQGDSGGPLTRGNNNFVLTGITSWGIGCARPDLYGVYTRVSRDGIRNFIEASTGGTSAQWEEETDRGGSDYKNFDLAQADPALCRNECSGDAKCKAWTYVKPGIQGTKARCWLKTSVPAATTNSCCTSGVRDMEYGVDRGGSDYKNFDLAKADPALCRNDCSGDAKCKAWTYVKPGVQGAKARCWLKTAVPNAAANDCCISGAKDMEYDIDRAGLNYKNFDLAKADPSLCKNECSSEKKCETWTYVKPGVQGAKARCWLKTGVPEIIANGCCISGVKDMEYDADRGGADYKNFDLAKADPALCQDKCNDEGKCKAWTYVTPGFQGPKARCWLKTSVPAIRPSDCCISGGKGMEHDTDRGGQDYKNFDLAKADPVLCQNKCHDEGKCKAWTYVKPGFQGAKARCWLKTGVPAAKPGICCISGVKK